MSHGLRQDATQRLSASLGGRDSGPAPAVGAGADGAEQVGHGRGDSYPGFLGSLSRALPPFSFLTSFSLLRLMEARSLLKEPLRLSDPVPS